MSEFVQGQRWVVDSEPELGLGIVVDVEGRSVTIFFPAADCERRYAVAQAPLTRIVFQVGEEVQNLTGQSFTVMTVHDQEGLLIYELDDGNLLAEPQLSPEIQLNQPFMRLMMGQIDKPAWFYFRRSLDVAISKVWSARLNGLLGVRASLIPHQLYVAHTACEQDAVRVLLADEVGLGKTIEAGLIMNRLLKQQRIQRVLIVVPDALLVQWLVELIRRFSIHPSLYSEEGHDFSDGQIHLLPHSAFVSEHEKLLDSDFDLTVVDEAHHIEAQSDAFSTLQALAKACRHLILMTATPEQLGFDSHFSRLNLLDPLKYDTVQALHEEESHYNEVNTLIRGMPENREKLITHFELDASLSDEELLNQVLDYYGTGRVMFRNARHAVSGFLKRLPKAHTMLDGDWETRFEWLAQTLKAQPDTKVLVITHAKEQVLDAEHYLWSKHGIDAAVFHEDLSLIERDRAAAYFADMDMGARVMLCSEIGSEGRNFQFSHHLICLDLPEHPDLLEQRIGRLDRIGQTQDITIDVLISDADADNTAARWHWFNDVLNCVAQQNPAAGAVHDTFWPGNHTALTAAIEREAKETVARLSEEIRNGRDALLELNSCREPQASALAKCIADFEKETPLELVDMASNLLNFHFEDLGSGRYSLIPADNMMIQALPGIPPEGVELTFDRDSANAREDVLFMTWDAPFIVGLWELLHHSDLGSACVAMLPTKQIPAGKCLLEACFDVVVQAENRADCLPFLASSSLRTLTLENTEKDLSLALPELQLQKSLQKVDKKLSRKIIKSQKESLPHWFSLAERCADRQQVALVEQALTNAQQYYDYERERMSVLAERNTFIVTDNEDALLVAKLEAIKETLKTKTHLQLSALRLIVTNRP